MNLPPRKASSNPGSRFVYLAAAVSALGGMLFGYDTGVISGAILFIRQDFSLSATAVEVVVSAVLLGAVIGAIAGGLSRIGWAAGRSWSSRPSSSLWAHSARPWLPPSSG